MLFGRKTALVICIFLVQVAAWGAPDKNMMSNAIKLRDQGEFEKATRVMQTWLDQNSTAVKTADRRAVEFEIERIRRIRRDYRLTREKLLSQLQDRLTTFTNADLDKYEREGALDVQLIDGQKLYVNPSASNLLFRESELRARKKHPGVAGSYRRLYEQMLTAEKASELTSLSLVLPQDWLVDFSIVVDANAAPEGKIIRAWLPFMHGFPFQADAAILKADPTPAAIAPPLYPHRTVYMEQPVIKDQKATFSLEFVYRSWARVNKLDPAMVRKYDKTAPEYTYYTAERKPHIDFSNEEIKRINNEISVGDHNPLLTAHRIYDWIAHNTIYQYAREYSTLDNISYYTASRRAGDCGQHSMLFIALCRMNGIPARWTTGWESFADSGENMHDWCEFYVEPWGWLPADPDMAVNIVHYADDMTTEQRTKLTDWLFGNMDNYRLTVNSDYSRTLFPAKKDFRSETVDFQRGEVESDGENLYFDKWSYDMRIKPIDAPSAEKLRAQFVPEPVKMPEPKPEPEEKAEPEKKTAQEKPSHDKKTSASADEKAEPKAPAKKKSEPKPEATPKPEAAQTSGTKSLEDKPKADTKPEEPAKTPAVETKSTSATSKETSAPLK